MRNKKRRQARCGSGDADDRIEHTRAFLDLTDKENEDFQVSISTYPDVNFTTYKGTM